MGVAMMRTHFLRPAEHPAETKRCTGRSTMCGIAGQIEQTRGMYEYHGGLGEMSDTIGEYRYEFTDWPDGVDCKRCLAAMKRAKIGTS